MSEIYPLFFNYEIFLFNDNKLIIFWLDAACYRSNYKRKS